MQGMSGKLDGIEKYLDESEDLPSSKPGHTTGESGRGARRSGGGVGQNTSPRGQTSLAPSKASKTRRLNVPPEARTSKILCEPMEEQNPRFIRGLIPGPRALFVPGC